MKLPSYGARAARLIALLVSLAGMPAHALVLADRLAHAEPPPPGTVMADLPPVDLKGAADVNESVRQDLADGARAHLGMDYELGGDGQDAIDCSALVQQIYRNAGLELPRTAREQHQASRAIDPSQARKGDLMFYRFKRGLHVAVYMDDGYIVHASPAAGRVVMTKLNDTWKQRLVGARRLL